VKRLPSSARRQTGASYVEVLIATLLIVISLVPMTDAVRGAFSGAAHQEASAVQQMLLIAKMEEVLAEPFSVLEQAAAEADGGAASSKFSDPAGATNRRLVFLAMVDGDNADADDDAFTGTDPGLMWVRTEIEGTQLFVESLVSQ